MAEIYRLTEIERNTAGAPSRHRENGGIHAKPIRAEDRKNRRMKKTAALSIVKALLDEGVLVQEGDRVCLSLDALPADAKLAGKPRAEPAARWDTDSRQFVIGFPAINAMQAGYPGVNIAAELDKATAWCVGNPARAPKSGAGRFLNSWMARAFANIRKSVNRDVGRNAAAATMAGE